MALLPVFKDGLPLFKDGAPAFSELPCGCCEIDCAQCFGAGQSVTMTIAGVTSWPHTLLNNSWAVPLTVVYPDDSPLLPGVCLYQLQQETGITCPDHIQFGDGIHRISMYAQMNRNNGHIQAAFSSGFDGFKLCGSFQTGFDYQVIGTGAVYSATYACGSGLKPVTLNRFENTPNYGMDAEACSAFCIPATNPTTISITW